MVWVIAIFAGFVGVGGEGRQLSFFYVHTRSE
jgi:hypothetical protein